MTRALVLYGVVAAGLMAMTVTAQQPPTGRAGRQGGARGGFNMGSVGAIQKVADNLYMVPGAGGNSAAYVAQNGVVLVDTKVTNSGQAILDQVKTVTDKPITHIINTHSHFDHTGSNAFFPASVEVVAHENTAANMQKDPAFQDAASTHALPDRRYKDRLTLLSGRDAIDLYYFGRAHTGGDSFVVFRDARVMHSGDAFAAKGQPIIDLTNGGSGLAFPETLDRAVNGIRNVDTIIGGHSPSPLKWQDLVDFAEFNRLFLNHARESLKAGKSAEQAMKDFKLPEKFAGYTLGATMMTGAGGNFETIYKELQSQSR